MLQVTLVTEDNYKPFLPFLTEEAGRMLEEGIPLVTLGLMDDDTACGVLAGYMESPSTFRINGLYVAPGFRRRGGAAMLLQTLGDILEPQREITEVVISYAETSEETALLGPLLESAEFVEEESIPVLYGVTLKEVLKSEFFSASEGSPNSRLLPFSRIPEFSLKLLDHSFREKNLPILKEPLLQSPVDRDVSVGYLAGKTIPAFLLFLSESPGVLNLAFAYTAGGETASHLLPALLRQACRFAREKYPPDTLLTIEAVNTLSDLLVERILRDVEYKILSHTARLQLERPPLPFYY